MKYKIIISVILLLHISLMISAQNSNQLKTIFDKYGKHEGSVLVQLTSDVLSQGCNIDFYKSLIMDYSSQKEQDVSYYIKQDVKTIITESKRNGKIESGTYLINSSDSKYKEYILYKNKSDKITVVYLKGSFPPQKLESELKKLKDLFIYVNNKRLKIQ